MEILNLIMVVVTTCCQVVTSCKQEELFFWRYAEKARKVFWRGGSGKMSVLAWREWQDKYFGKAGVAKKVLWRGRKCIKWKLGKFDKLRT